MVLPFILAVCLCGVFCLIPLAVYLWWLARVTRGEHPKPVSGPWDFAGLMVGLSGFVVFGGGLLLTVCQSNFRYWMRGNAEAFRSAWIQERVTWAVLVAFYLLAVAGVAGLTLLARRRTVVVYNVEPAAFETLLVEVFDQLGRPVERRGRQWIADKPLCEVDTFEAGRTVTLRWVCEDVRLFEEVDRQLRAALATQSTGDNPASRWLTAATVGSAVTAACSFGLLLYGLSLMR
ncbi:MAG: hypothetical protein J0I06_01035 [Planctomycetes bacterium]|nr:hypothetical protein [Planctomycetota bacterium]